MAKMTKFYFTFGSNPMFPFSRDEYVVIEADCMRKAVDIFNAVWQKRPGSNLINCSDIYDEEQWKETEQFYRDQEPSSYIRQGRCYGKAT